jgi:hypothetical protein
MIAFDAVAASEVAPGTSLTWSHTCSGSNRILFVGITILSGSDLVTGVTYDGVAMTRVATIVETGGTQTLYLYALVNPATGANNVVVSVSSSITIRATSASYTGARQSGIPDASGTKTTASTTSQALAVTTVTDKSWMVSFAIGTSDQPAASTGVTSRQSATNRALGDSAADITPAGSYSMTWTSPTSTNMAVVQASFAPLVATAGGAFLNSFV